MEPTTPCFFSISLELKKRLIAALFCTGALLPGAFAQQDTVNKTTITRIGIFAPLYLDSVFNKNTFRYRQEIPRFIMPALDFVQGAQAALDSLPARSGTLEATIYDSKAYTQNIPWLISNGKLDSLSLIIGNVKESDYRQLADFAQQRKIPFISATYPNDGGVTQNPWLVIVNPTLRSHCEALYSYILQNHGTDRIYLCRRKTGSQEDKVAEYIKKINEPDGTALLHIETLYVEGEPTAEYLKTKLDSNRHSVIIGAGLDETFAVQLANACCKLYGSYPITLLGMPTWGGFASWYKKDAIKNFPVFYTSPYYNDRSDAFSKMLQDNYTKNYKGKPTDMAFKGFEMVWLFNKLLALYPGNIISHLNDAGLKIIDEYNFKAVTLKKGNENPDYYENKHLYFIKVLNGVSSKAW